MKKILFLLLTVVTVCSCYNDDDLWDKVNDLDGRIETLETTVKKMNSEITTLQSLVDALNQGKVITNTEQTSDGYTLTFSDGSYTGCDFQEREKEEKKESWENM